MVTSVLSWTVHPENMSGLGRFTNFSALALDWVQNIFKIIDSVNFVVKAVGYSIDNLFRRYYDSGQVSDGGLSGKGHLDIYIAASRFCPRLEKACADPSSGNRISGSAGKLTEYNFVITRRKSGESCTMSETKGKSKDNPITFDSFAGKTFLHA